MTHHSILGISTATAIAVAVQLSCAPKPRLREQVTSKDQVTDRRGHTCERIPESVKCRWTENRLTFAFDAYPPRLDKMDYEAAVARAIEHWDDVLPLQIDRVELKADPDIVVTWALNGIADPLGFDRLARGELPPGCSLIFKCRPLPFIFMTEMGIPVAQIKWTIQGDPPLTDAYDIESVAVHEFGHMLGLGHCDDQGASGCISTGEIMQRHIKAGVVRRTLTLKDIKRVQYLYPN